MLVSGRVGTAPAAPDTPTLVFDGLCGFCRRWVGRLERLDRASAIRYIPLQQPDATEIAGCRRAQLRQALHFVGADGAVYAGAAAVREAFRYLTGGRIVRAVLGVPGVMPLAERGYGWVAQRWGPLPRRRSEPAHRHQAREASDDHE